MNICLKTNPVHVSGKWYSQIHKLTILFCLFSQFPTINKPHIMIPQNCIPYPAISARSFLANVQALSRRAVFQPGLAKFYVWTGLMFQGGTHKPSSAFFWAILMRIPYVKIMTMQRCSWFICNCMHVYMKNGKKMCMQIKLFFSL